MTPEEEKKAKEGQPTKFEITDEVKDLIGSTVNAAVGSHMKRGAFKEMLGAVVTETMAPMLDEVKKLVVAAPPKNDEEEAAGKGKKKGVDELPPEIKARLASLEEENAKVNKKLKLQEEKAEKEANEKRLYKERTTLTDALRAAGIPEGIAPAAAAMLHMDQKRVKTTKNDNDEEVLTFTVARPGGPEDWPVEKGVAEWIKTDQGKAFLPARDGGGAGGGGKGSLGGGGGKNGVVTDSDLLAGFLV